MGDYPVGPVGGRGGSESQARNEEDVLRGGRSLSKRAAASRGREGARGQTATEVMLVISVLVIAVAFFGNWIAVPLKNAFDDLFGEGTDTASSRNVPDQIERGYISEDPL